MQSRYSTRRLRRPNLVRMTEIAERSLRNELLRKDDWWAIWIGLGLVAVAVALFAIGGSIKWIAVAPQKWSEVASLTFQLQQHGAQYAALFVLWAVALGIGAAALASNCRVSCPRSPFFLGFRH